MTKHIDVDESWDGKGSLDEHRQREFEKIKQPGFGNNPIADPKPVPDPQPEVKDEDNGE